MSQDAAPASDEVAALRAALAAEQSARREAEARASGAEAMVAHLKLLISKLRQDRFGASSERGRKLLDQMELELEELEAAAAEDEAKVGAAGQDSVSGFTRRRTRARSTTRPPASGTRGGAGPYGLPLLRRSARQAGRERHRDPGGRASAVESHPNRP